MSSYLSGFSVSSVGASGNANLNALLSGTKWGGSIGNGVSLTFSFPWTTNTTALWDYGYSEPTATTHYGFNATQQTAAIAALKIWANVANIQFTQIAETGTEVGDIRFGFSSEVAASPGTWGWCYYPNAYWADGGDVWISTNLSGTNMDFSVQGYGFSALIHELGHGLGLKHPGNYSGSETGPFLPSALDNNLYSIMSYNEPTNNWWYDTQTSSWVKPFASTPMIYDIAAIQYMYGANTTYHVTDDIYTFDTYAPFLTTIWDAGGTDTISVFNSTRGSLINLNEGSLSSIQTTRFYSQNGISSTVDGSYNLGIAYGAIIENATGGSGADILIGNNVNNTLTGNEGNDTLDGGDGNDTLYGGAGNDTMDGGLGNDNLSYAGTTSGITINLALTTAQATGGAGTDTIINFENIIGSSYNDTLTGNNGNNMLNGGIGNDTLNGGDGNDIIDGGLGNDTLNGGTGIDTVSFASATTGVSVNLWLSSAQNTVGAGTDTIVGIENLDGSNYNDTLRDNGGANVVKGLNGDDILLAGSGVVNDSYDGGSGMDKLSYLYSTAGVTVDLSTTSAQNTVGAGTDTIVGIENLDGSNYNDTLRDDSSSNIIRSLGGNDTLLAGSGVVNDSYDAGGGIDTLSYIYSTASVTVNLYLSSAQNTVGAGTDTIVSIENLDGSNYNDTLRDNGFSNVINGLNGNDYLLAGGGAVNDFYDGGSGADRLSYYYNTSGVTVDLSTTSAQNTVGAGTDTIVGIENLDGSNHNDTLLGNSGSNSIRGLNGNDTINGGLGNDTFIGGSGQDIFIFTTTLNATTNKDTITDFSAVDDTIQLENAIFTALTSTGTLSASNFVASASGAAVDANDYILYNTSTGALYYDADGIGSIAALQFAILGTLSHSSISNADFMVS
ncbi:MAG: M10 family metallopeptidase [Sulfuricurvum sp.]|uniref:M10 family metallopeptidase n=1 Tax=Sulfuricurvum sp. TaxID=2025608 RepID=UPI00261049C6|nr:M10 family metallopeptidase [Sulfuricurvum sp.]MDD5161045.1 M10 family metallopeptidase [Sulfuricurvum sp.]